MLKRKKKARHVSRQAFTWSNAVSVDQLEAASPGRSLELSTALIAGKNAKGILRTFVTLLMFLKISRDVVSHKTNVFLDRLQSTSNVFKRGKYQDYMKVKIVAHTSEDDICNCSVLRLISGRISFEVARFSQTESICCKLSHFPSKLMYTKAEIFNGLEIPTDSRKRSFESHTSINFRAKTSYSHIITPQSIHFACQKYCCCL